MILPEVIGKATPCFMLPSGDAISPSNFSYDTIPFIILPEKLFRPVASGAYVLITRERDGQTEVLLARPRGQTYWGLIGGGVNEGEHPWQAAVREVCEEANLSIEAYIEATPRASVPTRHYAHPERGHQTTHIFFARVDEGLEDPQPVAQKGKLPEMEAFGWYTLDAAEALCRETNHPIMNDVLFALQFARDRHSFHNYSTRIVPATHN